MEKVTLSTSGTLGDTVCTVCKLYKMSQNNNIQVNHYTIHRNWHNKIREIYSLLPSVHVSFVDVRDEEHPRVFSHFAEDDGIRVTSFPKFELPKVKMPKRYTVLQERSGKDGECRSIPPMVCDRIINESVPPTVLLGTSTSAHGSSRDDVIDMTNETTLLEAFSIIRGAEEFHGFQGCLAFFALSQRIPTTIYCKTDADLLGVEVRLLSDWRLYLKDIVI